MSLSYTGVFDIEIRGLDELIVTIERLRRAARFRWPNVVMNRAADIMAEEIGHHAPVGRTRSIVDSVTVESGPDMRKVVVGAPHAVFVNEGTGPSPGRYVPAIDRRLKRKKGGIGIHPGVRATHFFDNAIEAAVPRIWAMHDRYMDGELEAIW